MPKYNTTSLINGLRERTKMEREAVLLLSKLDDSSLRRIEGERQNPTQTTLESIVKAIDLPVRGFIYSPLDNLSMDVILLCDRLTQLLDSSDISVAERVLAQLEAELSEDNVVLKQFILSKKAKLMELRGEPASDILPIIDEGMAITFEDFQVNAVKGVALILEEPELIHTKARVYAKAGEYDAAVEILENMIESLTKLPKSDKEKENLFAPLLLSLANCYIKTGKFERVIELCEQGAEYSAARKAGQLNPDFEYLKATALYGLNRTEECKKPLQHAYFGYMLLGETDKAISVLETANERFNIAFELYGVDNSGIPYQPKIPYNRGDSVDCYSFGTMVCALREKAGLSIEQLSHGLCSGPTLMRIEHDGSLESIFTIEAIMQRLGRDVSLYKNFFLKKEDFIAVQLRDRINTLFRERRHDVAEQLLGELESMKNAQKQKVLRQFVKMSKAIILNAQQSAPHPDFPGMLADAMKITCPNFDERNINRYYLTHNESSIINCYAGHFVEVGDLPRANDIYEQLYRNLARKYVDEYELSRAFSTVLFNYSTSLGRSDRQNEAMSVITDGENFEKRRRNLVELPGFAYNRGYNMVALGEKEKSLPYFAMAYYGASLFAKQGLAVYLPYIQGTVSREFRITFD